jgi:hypothetical protein
MLVLGVLLLGSLSLKTNCCPQPTTAQDKHSVGPIMKALALHNYTTLVLGLFIDLGKQV